MPEARSTTVDYENGVRCVELAREALETFVAHGHRENPGSMADPLYTRTGALVRLESTRGRGRLRGCAGRCRTDDHLGEVIVDAAIDAASGDSCGSALAPSELSATTVSTFVVTDADRTSEPTAGFRPGRDGVAVHAGDGPAWLFPTLALRNDWSGAEYLERTCRTAGLAPDAWRDDAVETVRFSGVTFRERTPEGGIEEL